MTRHRVDAISLVFGVLLLGAAVVAGIAQWTSLALRADVIIPVAMILLGGLILVLVLTRRDT